MNTPPTNMDDVIDSRDVIERIEELETNVVYAEDEAIEDRALAGIIDELTTLKALADDCESVDDWPHGETLIRDTYFQEYAQQLAEDCGMITARATWPAYCIDWEQTARELQMDYMSVEFDGVDYWIRA